MRAFARPPEEPFSVKATAIDVFIGAGAALYASDWIKEIIPAGSETARGNIAPLIVGMIGTGGIGLIQRVIQIAQKDKKG